MFKSKRLIIALAAVFVCTAAIFAALTAFIATPGLAGQKNGLLHAFKAIGFAPVEQTGQTESFVDGDDGDLQMGISSPDPRFTDNLDGTVTDNLTGLIWLKDVHCMGVRDWADALTQIANLNMATDFSCSDYVAGTFDDWRFPNVKELKSLIHYGVYDLALPDKSWKPKLSDGEHSTHVQSYHSRTSNASFPYSMIFDNAWIVDMSHEGTRDFPPIHIQFYAFPVRGGN